MVKAQRMTSAHNKRFAATVDERLPALYEMLSSTISHLVYAAQTSSTTLENALSSLLQSHGFTPQHTAMTHSLVYTRESLDATQTLLLYNDCSPQPDTFARWHSFVTYLLTSTLYQEVLGDIPVNLVWLLDTTGREPDEKLLFLQKNRELLRADGCLSTLPTDAPFLALGTKGLLRVELTIRTAPLDHPTRYGSVLPNAAWRLLWALNTIKDVREEILVEGFYDTLAPMGDAEIELLRTLPDSAETLIHRLQVEHLLLRLNGFQLSYTQYLLPTCTITALQSGDGSTDGTTIPAFARASVELQLVPDQEPTDIAAKLRHHLDAQGFADVQMAVQASVDVQYTPLHDPFVRLVVAATRAIYQERVPLLPLVAHEPGQYPLHSLLGIPVAFIGSGTPHANPVPVTEAQSFGDAIKQLAMIIAGMASLS